MLDLTIVSGGQDGADVASWRAARAAGLPTAGVMPHGFRTLSGPHPEYAALYNAQEHESTDWPPRTRANVAETDGTLLMFWDTTGYHSSGSKLTRSTAQEAKKPLCCIDLSRLAPTDAQMVADWITKKNIRRLNCAGNRDISEPDVERFLGEVFAALDALTGRGLVPPKVDEGSEPLF